MPNRIDNSKLFSFFFGMWIFFRTVGNPNALSILNIGVLSSITKVCLLVIGVYCFVFSNKTIKAWIITVICLLVLIVVLIKSNNVDFPFSIFIVLVAAQFDKKKIYKAFFRGMAIGMLFVLFLYVIGIVPDVVQIRLGIVRHSFGFSLPLILPALYFSLVCAYLFAYQDKVTWKSLMIIFFVQIPIYIYCDGRAPLILTSLGLLGVIVIKYANKRKLRDVFLVLGVISLVLALLISFYFAKYYNGSSVQLYNLNQQLTGRLEWWNLYWTEYSPKLFGQILTRTGGAAVLSNSSLNAMILDNGYLSIFLEYGVASFAMFITLVAVGLIELWKKNELIGMMLWILWICYGVVSNQIYFVDRNIGLILLVSFFSIRVIRRKEVAKIWQ